MLCHCVGYTGPAREEPAGVPRRYHRSRVNTRLPGDTVAGCAIAAFAPAIVLRPLCVFVVAAEEDFTAPIRELANETDRLIAAICCVHASDTGRPYGSSSWKKGICGILDTDVVLAAVGRPTVAGILTYVRRALRTI